MANIHFALNVRNEYLRRSIQQRKLRSSERERNAGRVVHINSSRHQLFSRTQISCYTVNWIMNIFALCCCCCLFFVVIIVYHIIFPYGWIWMHVPFSMAAFVVSIVSLIINWAIHMPFWSHSNYLIIYKFSVWTHTKRTIWLSHSFTFTNWSPLHQISNTLNRAQFSWFFC